MIRIGCSSMRFAKLKAFAREFNPFKYSNLCKLTESHRTFTNNSRYYSAHAHNPANVKEIEIPLPFGKIAAKAWGSEKASPVLAMHGWLDNCGTFDKLIPLLSDQFYVVAIDMPGHGRSSPLPPGLCYTDDNSLLHLMKTVEHLGWKRFHVMSHSLGASLGLLFASIFPDLVDKFVSLETLKTMSLPADAIPDSKITNMGLFLGVEQKLKNPPPVYAADSMFSKLKTAMQDEITEESARVLLRRGTRPSECGTGVVLSRDLRWQLKKHMINVESDEVIEGFMSRLRCKLLVTLSKNANPVYQHDTLECVEKYVKIYEKNLPYFKLERVEGNHYVHLNQPENIAPLINRFLLNE